MTTTGLTRLCLVTCMNPWIVPGYLQRSESAYVMRTQPKDASNSCYLLSPSNTCFSFFRNNQISSINVVFADKKYCHCRALSISHSVFPILTRLKVSLKMDSYVPCDNLNTLWGTQEHSHLFTVAFRAMSHLWLHGPTLLRSWPYIFIFFFICGFVLWL